MVTEIYKLARPLMKSVVVEVANGKPYIVSLKYVRFHKAFREVREPLANRMVNDMLGGMPSFRGEIVIGKPIDPECYELSRQFLELENLIHPFVFWVYDLRTVAAINLKDRLEMTKNFVVTCGPVIQYVDHELIESQAALDAYKKTVMDENFFPGIVLREPYGTFGTEDEVITGKAAPPTAAN